jgi:hypothetical protein
MNTRATFKWSIGLLVVVGLVGAIPACKKDTAPPVGQPATVPRQVEPPAQEGTASPLERARAFFDQGIDVGENPEQAKGKLGPVLKEAAEQIPNPHVPEQMDERIDLVFQGVELSFYHMRPKGAAGKFARIGVKVTDPAIKLMFGLGVGAGAEKVQAILGTPDDDAAGAALIYYPHRSEVQDGPALRFDLAASKVKKITWEDSLD